MINKHIYIGKSKKISSEQTVKGDFVTIDNELFYKISNYDHMDPFFMSIVSPSDHWMFIWSNGGLSAGRKNPDSALFPYYTDDKIKDDADITGSKTLFLIDDGEKTSLWEPFSEKYAALYDIRRNIYKNLFGNKIIFEEINDDLGIAFQYGWLSSEKFGFAKHNKIINLNESEVSVNLLDGIQNILPYGVERREQEQYSTLIDGYKKSELDSHTDLGLFMMSSILTDKAEPSEALKATTVWSCGIRKSKKLLSANQLDLFRKGLSLKQESDVKATRCAYFINSQIKLVKKESKEWYIVAEISQDAADVVNLNHLLKSNQNLAELLDKDIVSGTESLAKIVANADGLQLSTDLLSNARHYSNVLFNVLRGGTFENNYQIRKEDLLSFLEKAQKPLIKRNKSFIDSIADKMEYLDLISLSAKENDADLERLLYEYLPIFFSRRHGDPSRPWNAFSIDLKNEDGSVILNYQGNWRDIFQNWEALGLSFPGYIESMICKFLNASTADGYNPYRITREGVDWEVHDPADPWSNIGYWGDHQIIYMLKLLELSDQFHPGELDNFLTRNIFSYANVPYRIKPYSEILDNPKDTITFDDGLHATIFNKVEQMGSDGKLILDEDERVYHVNLCEKLLVSVLSKFANFIPQAGIWLNTQRPEWNDANNALVGHGASMVTLYYLRRFQLFCISLFEKSTVQSFKLSGEVFDFFQSVKNTFSANQKKLQATFSDMDRRQIMDELGEAGGRYRDHIYSNGFQDLKKILPLSEVMDFLNLSLKFIDHSIAANKRADNLYHAYNLISIRNDGSVSIRHLYEMLEGQVAVLSCGFLDAADSLLLLSTLKKSSLYREDQNSYILYPNRNLPRFTEKNNISAEDYNKSILLKKWVADGNRRVVIEDVEGGIHFNGEIRNADVLNDIFVDLRATAYTDFVEEEWQLVHEIYEKVFDHQSFTGRSGTFYKYEGLGSIYWHMVSKLLLAVQETYFNFIENGKDKITEGKLIEFYYDIRAGIGMNKSAQNYGAFPSDPYSHTPEHTGALQPGMTGQVKEDIISRFGELGVIVKDGQIIFKSGLLRKEEFLTKPATFNFYDIHGDTSSLNLPAKSLAFTIAQVPVVYHLGENDKIVLTMAGKTKTIDHLTINKKTCTSIFGRKGKVQKIDVFFKAERLN